MRDLPFTKVIGSGNDFILLDLRKGSIRLPASLLAVGLCDRRRSVGADGLLLIEPSSKADVQMRIFNPDGSEAEMCGNGLRCVAWYLYTQDHSGKRISVQTKAGILPAQVVGKERVRVFLNPPENLRLGRRLSLKAKTLTLHSIDTGVPHAVLFASSLDRIDLASLGPAIRHHRSFWPKGTNVDVVQIRSSHAISLRTYERGVEAETPACGTGAVAASLVGSALGKLNSPVKVRTAGGESLTVRFRKNISSWQEISLEGSARILFTGFMEKR